MTINKFQGKTEQEAVEKARKEMGANAVIMNVRQIKPRGFLSSLKGPTYEVTAAIEEREQYRDPIPALKTPLKMHDNISVAADENISLPPLGGKPQAKTPVLKEQPQPKAPELQEHPQAGESEELKGRLENLQKLLEEKLPQEDKKKPAEEENRIEAADRKNAQSEEFRFLKTVYGILLDHEVDEKYVNEILDDVEKVARHGNGVDLILSNIYQKMILKFGTPKTIEFSGKKPKVVFFIGPTGVGKTTTIA